MNVFTGALAATSLLLVLAACGSDQGDADTISNDVAEAPSSSTTPSSTQPADDSVTSVTLRRTGGMKGDRVDRSFVAGQAPPQGFTAAEQDSVIGVAQELVDAGVTLEPMPENTCCDRYTYVVIVAMADGSSATYTALDGEPQPPEFTQLLTQLS